MNARTVFWLERRHSKAETFKAQSTVGTVFSVASRPHVDLRDNWPRHLRWVTLHGDQREQLRTLQKACLQRKSHLSL